MHKFKKYKLTNMNHFIKEYYFYAVPKVAMLELHQKHWIIIIAFVNEFKHIK
jgi:hypothetical protein